MAGRSKPPQSEAEPESESGPESAKAAGEKPRNDATDAAIEAQDAQLAGRSGDGSGTEPENPDAASAAVTPEMEPEPEVADEPGPEAAAAPQDRAASPHGAPERPAPPPPPRRSGGLLALLIGGALAAAIGFAAARYVLPEGWPVRLERAEPAEAAEARAALEARVSGLEAALDARLAEMEQALAQPAGDGADMAQVEAAITARLDAALAPLAEVLDSLQDRVATLEERPATVAAEGTAITSEEVARLDALRATLEQRRSDLEALQTRLEETAQAAEARVADAAARLDDLAATADGLQRSMALTRLRADMAAGLPFDAALQGLRAAGAEVPEALARHAAGGVASLDALRRGFPAAAREGLAAALQAQGGEDWGARAVGYLRAQVGARSLAPRAGDDPDAVLSRAEAALAAGDLDGALAELQALNEAGRAAMAGWISGAEAHLAVAAALDSLAAGN